MTLEKYGPKITGDQAVEFMRGQKLDSPRGPIEINAKTRCINQNVYLRRVIEKDGRLVNENFKTIPMVADPWPTWNPAAMVLPLPRACPPLPTYWNSSTREATYWP